MYFIGVADNVGLDGLPHLGVCWFCVYRDLLSISLPSEVCSDEPGPLHDDVMCTRPLLSCHVRVNSTSY